MEIKTNNQVAESLQDGFAGINGMDSDVELFDVSDSLADNSGTFGGGSFTITISW